MAENPVSTSPSEQTALPEAVILDFGGVLYDIDYDAPVRAFAALGVEDFAAIYHQHLQSDLFDALETGGTSPHAFLEALQSHCRPGTSLQAVSDAWDSILTGMKPGRLAMLTQLKGMTRLFLLSNTNVLHARRFEAWIEEHVGSLSAWRGVFEAVHYSHELGMRKPHPETFRNVCQMHGLAPEKTWFIDDSIQHVEGARRAGLEATHLLVPGPVDVRELLIQRGFKLD
jgi:putative hydrolase of the HAD superfamily